MNKKNDKKLIIYHFKGNVSEWSNEDSCALGGSWQDSLSDLLNKSYYKTNSPNAWTGFRNVAHWERWDK